MQLIWCAYAFCRHGWCMLTCVTALLTATHCNSLQLTATHCNLLDAPMHFVDMADASWHLWRHNSSTCVTWCMHICEVTNEYVRHDFFKCLTWLIYVWTWRVQICDDITDACVWSDTYDLTWLMCMHDMTHSYASGSYVWHAAFKICFTILCIQVQCIYAQNYEASAMYICTFYWKINWINVFDFRIHAYDFRISIS